jgi:hypothetical protein
VSLPQQSSTVAEALKTIERKVAERRATGEYPAGLEEQLDRWFKEFLRTAHDNTGADLTELRQRQADLNGMHGFSAARIDYSSRNPVAGFVHKATGAAVRRQTEAILAQNQEFADQVRRTVDAVADVLERVSGAHSSEALSATLSGILDRLAVVDQLVVRVGDLEKRLAEVDEHRTAD